jgi:hypothetical protein
VDESAEAKMQILPYRRVELSSPLPIANVLQALSDAVAPPRSLRLGLGRDPFEGTVTGTEFRIHRIIGYRNSFRPQISGTVAPDGQGSRISITMRLHAVVAVFMAIWFGGVFMVGVAFTAATLAGGASVELALFPLAMLLFGGLLCLGGFSYEARKAERLIMLLVQAEPPKAPEHD